MRMHVYHHYPVDDEVPPWVCALKDRMDLALDRLETIMDDIEELNAGLAEVSGLIGKVSGDTDNLLAQLSNIPTGGMTPEQQAGIATAKETVRAMVSRLKEMDDKVPDPVAPPAPEPTPDTPPSA
jgi:uncharacterized coiled-coil protein SlyX